MRGTSLFPTGATARRAAAPRRRGVTLVEMLITVALLVLMMTILVEIFRNATGAVTTQRAFASIDQDIRRVDALLRQDLGGITAKMSLTPSPRAPKETYPQDWPASPNDSRGYFVYGENDQADAQGEDTDDYLAFTSNAPQGRPFTGYITVPVNSAVVNATPTAANPVLFHRVPITSDNAEVIYFLRNGNLYRRVFLILSPTQTANLFNPGTISGQNYINAMFVSGGTFDTVMGNGPAVVIDTKGLYGIKTSWIGLNDVSAQPARFSPSIPITQQPPVQFNTLFDLTNRENRVFSPRFCNDYGTTIPGTLGMAAGLDGIPDDADDNGVPDWYPTLYPGAFAAGLINDGLGARGTTQSLPFPFLYPNAYSLPAAPAARLDQIHTIRAVSGATIVVNHSPLDLGDPLGPPSYAPVSQTWWGFPTKKETMSSLWTDPVWKLNANAGAQSLGLIPATFTAGTASASPNPALPPVTDAFRGAKLGQLYTDGSGGSSFYTGGVGNTAGGSELYQALVEEDLVLSNVRSFDVKGLDPFTGMYVDLGYDNAVTGYANAVLATNKLYTLAHEGRIPPLPADFRVDPQTPVLPNGNPNLLGDSAAGIPRLRRVWDSWSTDYAWAPASGRNHFLPGAPVGKDAGLAPVYPSYPPPYPVSLRGIQIQLRVVDPTNQKVKSYTIRQDFSKNMN
jgi:hypothetical protein